MQALSSYSLTANWNGYRHKICTKQ